MEMGHSVHDVHELREAVAAQSVMETSEETVADQVHERNADASAAMEWARIHCQAAGGERKQVVEVVAASLVLVQLVNDRRQTPAALWNPWEESEWDPAGRRYAVPTSWPGHLIPPSA